jgi:hypothetical protein
MKKELVNKKIEELQNQLNALKKEVNEPELKARLCNVYEIFKYATNGSKAKTLLQVLNVVAEYCNKIDKKTDRRFYPVWNELIESTEVFGPSNLYFATPHFNSMVTLDWLIDENEQFFTELLKPKE